MTGIELHAVDAPRRARFDDEDTGAAAAGLAHWLHLAATPSFAMMALLTGLEGSPMDKLCSAAPGAPLSGMLLMYVLMSAFHAGPWLKLIFGGGRVGPA